MVRRTIIVPVANPIDKGKTIEECQSPLIKKKKQKSASSNQNSFHVSDASKSPSPTKSMSPQKENIKEN